MNDESGLKKAFESVDQQIAEGAEINFGTDRPPSKQQIEKQLKQRVEAEDGAFDDAHWVISRAIARGGRNPVDPQPTDSAALRHIVNTLLAVQMTQ